MSGPTPEDRAAGMAAAVDTAIAGTLRKLAALRLGELDHTHLPLKGGRDVPVVAVGKVQEWLEDWATRIENGEAV